MRIKRPPGGSPWLPEQQLVWTERERLVALWMHGAAARDWVLRLLIVIGRVGDGWIWYAVIVGLPWLDRTTGTSVSVRMIAVGLVNLVIYRIVKRWIARPRPFRACPGIRECDRSLDEFSFPSGHTLHSVAFSVVLTVYHPVLGLLVWPLTLLIAVSRVVLGLHYPSDVIVGALIGAATAAISFNLL